MGNIIAVLVMTQIICLILGMGLPTTANYIVMASLVVPVVLNLAEKSGLQVPAVAAHLFVFYFGIMADSTPPVALAAYAASAIAKSDFWRTGVQGFIYEMRTAFLAYMFFFNPKLLLIGVNGFLDGLEVVLSGFVGMVAFASGVMGFLHRPLGLLQRLLLLGAAVALVTPGIQSDLVGAGLLLLVYIWQRMASARAELRQGSNS